MMSKSATWYQVALLKESAKPTNESSPPSVGLALQKPDRQGGCKEISADMTADPQIGTLPDGRVSAVVRFADFSDFSS